jgi:ankyrin repeat protein
MNKTSAIFSLCVVIMCIPQRIVSMNENLQRAFNECIEQAMKASKQSPKPNIDLLQATFQIMETLDLSKVDVNARDSIQGTALHSAAVLGSLKHVKLLIQHGGKLSLSCREATYGNTPLHLAAWYGHAEVIHYLLEQGANKDEPNNLFNTPIALAVAQSHQKAAQLLRSNN